MFSLAFGCLQHVRGLAHTQRDGRGLNPVVSFSGSPQQAAEPERSLGARNVPGWFHSPWLLASSDEGDVLGPKPAE